MYRWLVTTFSRMTSLGQTVKLCKEKPNQTKPNGGKSHFSTGSVKISFTFQSFFKVKTLKISPYWSHSGPHKQTQGKGDPDVLLKFSLQGVLLSRAAVRESPAFPIFLVTAPFFSSHCGWGAATGARSQHNGKLQIGKYGGCIKQSGGHASGEKREKNYDEYFIEDWAMEGYNRFIEKFGSLLFFL